MNASPYDQLGEAGIEIPFPQCEVRLIGGAVPSAG